MTQPSGDTGSGVTRRPSLLPFASVLRSFGYGARVQPVGARQTRSADSDADSDSISCLADVFKN